MEWFFLLLDATDVSQWDRVLRLLEATKAVAGGEASAGSGSGGGAISALIDLNKDRVIRLCGEGVTATSNHPVLVGESGRVSGEVCIMFVFFRLLRLLAGEGFTLVSSGLGCVAVVGKGPHSGVGSISSCVEPAATNECVVVSVLVKLADGEDSTTKNQSL